MIICVQGKQRNGKTVLMTNLAYEYHKGGFHVISNIELKFPYIDFDEEMFYSDDFIVRMKKEYKTNKFIIILADAHLLLSAHMARKDARKLYFVTQVMKMLEEEGHLIYDTQKYFQMNKTLRENTDAVFNVRKISMKGEPLMIEVKALSDTGTAFEETNEIILTQQQLKLGLFERFGRTKLSESYGVREK